MKRIISWVFNTNIYISYCFLHHKGVHLTQRGDEKWWAKHEHLDVEDSA